MNYRTSTFVATTVAFAMLVVAVPTASASTSPNTEPQVLVTGTTPDQIHDLVPASVLQRAPGGRHIDPGNRARAIDIDDWDPTPADFSSGRHEDIVVVGPPGSDSRTTVDTVTVTDDTPPAAPSTAASLIGYNAVDE